MKEQIMHVSTKYKAAYVSFIEAIQDLYLFIFYIPQEINLKAMALLGI